MAKDILEELDSLTEKTPETKPVKVVEPTLGRVNYSALKKIAQTTKIFAVKNTAKYDIVTDWDLTLIPEDLKPKLDDYLNEKYNQFGLKEVLSGVKMMAILVKGRTVNFMHDFMTDQRIPVLVNVVEGPSMVIRSQCVIPADKVVLCTEEQYTSLKRYEKRRNVDKDGKPGSWEGELVFKELPVESFTKVSYSMVTEEDIRNAGFDVTSRPPVVKRLAANVELSDELDDLV